MSIASVLHVLTVAGNAGVRASRNRANKSGIHKFSGVREGTLIRKMPMKRSSQLRYDKNRETVRTKRSDFKGNGNAYPRISFLFPGGHRFRGDISVIADAWRFFPIPDQR